MFDQGKTGGLTPFEKRIVKYLIAEKWTNQDIQALVNLERPATINPARIATVKKDKFQAQATSEEYAIYFGFKRSFDLKTGLNPFIDERLIKSREAMKLAISIFNNPTFQFRAENFSMLANVAWTYLALEYSARKGLPTERKDGKAVSLSDFLNGKGCPFSSGIVNNLRAMIKIRDAAEHKVLGPYDSDWVGIFQACCMNFESVIVEHFGERLSLSSEVSFALQLSGLSVGQALSMSQIKAPKHIDSINKEIFGNLTENEKNDKDFQFSVVYTTVETSKSKAAIQFVSPKSAEGREIANVLVKYRPSQITHPYKPTDVVGLVRKKTGAKFELHEHTLFWKKNDVRPASGSAKPEETKLEYCFYNATFKSYTYNDAWVDLIVGEVEGEI